MKFINHLKWHWINHPYDVVAVGVILFLSLNLINHQNVILTLMAVWAGAWSLSWSEGKLFIATLIFIAILIGWIYSGSGVMLLIYVFYCLSKIYRSSQNKAGRKNHSV